MEENENQDYSQKKQLHYVREIVRTIQLLNKTNKCTREEVYELYFMGLINYDEYVIRLSNEEIRENIRENLTEDERKEYEEFDTGFKNHPYRIALEDNYIVLNFNLWSMMVCDEYVEDVICEEWPHVRKGISRFKYLPELQYLKDNNLGVKIKASACIGGEGYLGKSAVVYTPEDIQTLLESSF